VPWCRCRDPNVSNPWFSYTIDGAIIERNIPLPTAASKLGFKVKVKRPEIWFVWEKRVRLLDSKLPSKVLWRNLDEMGVRDSGGSDIIISSEELSNYFSSLRNGDASMVWSHGAPPVTPVEYGHDELFSFSNVTDNEVFYAIRGIKFEAVELEFRGSFG
jgi:hypothetical protein